MSAPLERSPVFFESMAEAAKDGKKALGQFLANGRLRSPHPGSALASLKVCNR